MNSYFERLDLEMIALESAIGAFEAENDITDEYLHDYSDYEAPAYESATSSSDDFGFNLFDDMYAPANEEADGSAGGKGGKLSQGIKNILSNIGKFFGKIRDGIVKFFESFKKKRAEVNAEQVKENAAPEALKLANDIRGAIRQAFNIIGNVTVSDTKFIASLCEKISAAINAAGGSDALVGAHSKIAKFVDDDADTDAMAAAGKALRTSGAFGDAKNENENRANTEKKLAEAQAILDKVEATGKDIDAALANVKTIFQKEFAAAANKLRQTKSKELTVVNDDTEFDRERREDEEAAAEKRAKAASSKEVHDFNKEAKKRKSVGGAQYARDTSEIDGARLINQVRQIVFVDYDVEALNKAIQAVINACKQHAGNCEKLANKTPASVSGDAKIAYDMCKILSRSSTIYTHISNSIQQLTSGSIFSAKLSDGTHNVIGPNGFRAKAADKATARSNQRAYLDE